MSFAGILANVQEAAINLVTHGEFYEQIADIVVMANAVFVFIEIDMPEMIAGLERLGQISFAVFYVVEFAAKFVLNFDEFKTLRVLIEVLIVVIALVGAFAMPDNKLLWRLSVFRLVRITRATKKAATSMKMADLWVVLTGFWTSLRTTRWLALMLFFAVIIFGGGARGLIGGTYARGEEVSDYTTAVCGGDAFRTRLKCIQVQEYFGSIYNTCFTMFQLVTLDRWAAHVVRPVAGISPFAAGFLTLFVLVTAYGLMSIGVGVIVWSTTEISKNHDSHRNRVLIVQDKERIHELREYFQRCLDLEDRAMLDFREIKEAMAVPSVKHAYDELNLPVTDIVQLWTHLDQHSRGEISLDEFEERCCVLQEPAKRFDMACLSARLNGRAVFADNLAVRCEALDNDMDDLFRKLTFGFKKLRNHVLSEDVNDIFPEVGLRRAGKMKIPREDD